MQNAILCRNNGRATHIVEFTTIEGNVFSVLTDEPNNVQAVLESAEEYIWANGLENDVPGYIADASAMPEDEIIRLGCEGGFENCFYENVHVNPLSRADLFTYISNGEFMQPNIYRGEVFEVFPENGESYYTTEYPEDEKSENVERLTGYYAYVSANGYMDMTEVGLFETEAEAIDALIDYYCE